MDPAQSGAERLMEAVLGDRRGSLLGMLEARSRLHPDAPFLSWHAPGEEATWSYAQAWQAVRCANGGWRRLGVRPDSVVATFLGNHPDAVWAWFGAQAAGAVWAPINRGLRGPLLAELLDRTGADHLLVDADALEDLRSSGVDLDAYDLVFAGEGVPIRGSVTITELLREQPVDPMELEPASVGYLSYTSGSTGRTKAARLPHNHLVRHGAAYAHAFRFGPGDVTYGWNPLFHMGGCLPATMAGGAEYALYPRFSASRFWDQVRESRATYIEGFPVIIQILAQQPPTDRDRDHSLRTIFVAGGDPQSVATAETRFGVRVVNAYGMTEAEAVMLPDLSLPSPEGSCGLLDPGYEVKVLDEAGAAVGDGVVGELVLRPRVHDILFKGYEGDAEATIEAWEDLWFHTGDLMRRDESGYYYFLGRKAHRIRRRGENVSELELTRLLQSHPAVHEAVVVTVPSELGEDDIKACLVLGQGQHLSAPEYATWCRSSIPKYMRPRYFEIYPELPRLSLGKVDIQEARSLTDSVYDAEAVGEEPTRAAHAG